MNALGIEIGGTKLQLVLGEGSGRILHRRRLVVERRGGANGIREQIARTLPELLPAEPLAAVGVGFGGPVEWRTGKICCSHQIAGWSGFDLGGWLREQTGRPVVVDNDGDVAALGEALCGAGAGHDPVFYVTLGSGVGGGLVCSGRIYHGAAPGEAEIGHVRLDRSGSTVESRCCGWAMDARVRALKNHEPDALLARLAEADPGAEARHLTAALQQHDAAAERLLAELTEDLAFGLSHVVHLFHPEIIVLGGGLANLGEPLRAGVEAALRRFVMEAFAPGPKIALTALRDDAVPVGALCLAMAALPKG